MLSSSLITPCRLQPAARWAMVSTRSRRTVTASRRRFASGKGEGPLVNDPLAVRRQAQEARQKRADRLHEEIAAITQKQDQRHAEEAKKLKGWKGFAEFLGKNKTNLSVIVVSFMTVVLSVKLVQGKQKYQTLEKEFEVAEAQDEEKRRLLKTLTSDEFVSELAAKCVQEVNDNRPKRSGWLGSGSGNTNDTTTLLSNILAQHLSTTIGEAALNEDEKSAKELNELNYQPITGDAAIQALQQSSSSAYKEGDNEGTWAPAPSGAAGEKSNKKSVFVI